MKAFLRILVSLLLLSTISLVGCSKSDSTIGIKEDDAEMNAAIAKARETLPQFWKEFDHPAQGEDDFCLKVKIKDGEEVEHFWVAKLEKKAEKTFGLVSNAPDL